MRQRFLIERFCDLVVEREIRTVDGRDDNVHVELSRVTLAAEQARHLLIDNEIDVLVTAVNNGTYSDLLLKTVRNGSLDILGRGGEVGGRAGAASREPYPHCHRSHNHAHGAAFHRVAPLFVIGLAASTPRREPRCCHAWGASRRHGEQ